MKCKALLMLGLPLTNAEQPRSQLVYTPTSATARAVRHFVPALGVFHHIILVQSLILVCGTSLFRSNTSDTPIVITGSCSVTFVSYDHDLFQRREIYHVHCNVVPSPKRKVECQCP